MTESTEIFQDVIFNRVTFVTAYFDLNRSRVGYASKGDYLNWFDEARDDDRIKSEIW